MIINPWDGLKPYDGEITKPLIEGLMDKISTLSNNPNLSANQHGVLTDYGLRCAAILTKLELNIDYKESEDRMYLGAMIRFLDGQES